MTPRPKLPDILRTIYGDDPGVICLFTGTRNPETGKIDRPHESFVDYPRNLERQLVENIKMHVQTGQEVYVCAHLLQPKTRRRIKANAADVWSLYADIDDGETPDHLKPTVEIESSPGRKQGYWRLTRSIPPAFAEQLNRRLARFIGADPSGFDLGQLLRVPGTPNHKYDGSPTVRVTAFDPDRRYDPDELDELLPRITATKAKSTPQPTVTPLGIDDDELRRRCEGNLKFGRLWDGDDSDYGDDTSAGDLAFCNIVVRNGGDRHQIDALYRASKRARDKWDDRRGDSIYGAWTIERALDGTVVPFTPRQAEPKPHLADLPADDLPNDVASLKAIIIDLRTRIVAAEERAEQAETRATKLSELQSKTTGILRNNKLGQERLTGVALSYLFANREAAGDAGDGGLYRMPLARIGEPVGVSEDTAGRHIQKFEKEGLIKREVRWVPEAVDPATGEITGGHRALFIGPTTNVTDFVEAVAHLDPEKPKNWGGARTQCPNHPTANIVKTTVWSCQECGMELRSETETIRPNPQDADIDELAATGTEGPRARSHHQRGRNYSSGSGAASHNVGPSQAEIERAYQQLNAIPAVPADRWTDVSIGGRP